MSRMPGRKKSAVNFLFEGVENYTSKCKKVKCKFCSKELVRNGTRMTKHIINCTKCDESLKAKYLNGNNNGKRGKTMEFECPEFSENNEYQESELDFNTLFAKKLRESISSDTATKNMCNSFDEYLGGEIKPTICLSERSQSSTPYICTPHNNEICPHIDSMSSHHITQSQLDLARAIFASGCSFNIVENKYWKRLFKCLCPSFKMPNRDMVSNSLLEQVYQESTTKSKELIASAQNLALVCDGWSNHRNDGILDLILTSPKPIFWTRVATGSKSHNGEYMGKIMKKVIKEVGAMKVLGLCTDNSTNMNKTWQLIQEEFPHIHTYGCLAHTLHLIFTDVIKIKSAENTLHDCCNIVKLIRKSPQLITIFKKNQENQTQKMGLKHPVKTKCFSVIYCIKSIQKNMNALQSLAIDVQALQAGLDLTVKNLILSDLFWLRVDGFLKLLNPVGVAIRWLEGDNRHLSVVMKVFHHLETSVTANLHTNQVMKNEQEYLLSILQNKKSLIARPVHYAANLLDPRYTGIHLTVDEKMDAMEVILKIAQNIPGINPSKVFEETASFRAKENPFGKSFIWANVNEISPTKWWKGIFCDTDLSKVATGVLNLPPTSLLGECSLNRNPNVFSTKHLTNERATKLTFISHNLALASDDEEDEAMKQASNQQTPSTSKDALVDITDSELDFSEADD